MSALTAVITYLIVYAAMNLGAFAVVIAVARKTRSGEISTYGGLCSSTPRPAVAMTFFLFSLAGIPPLGGWVAKFACSRRCSPPAAAGRSTLAVIGAVNSVIALFYYADVAGDVDEPGARRRRDAGAHPAGRCVIALGITAAPLLVGVLPNVVLHFGDLTLPGRGALSDARRRPASRIARHGPLPFDAFVEAALYDPDDGFYATRGAAGRRGDFLTCPEVGPLFGAVLARALDAWWDELGTPRPVRRRRGRRRLGTLARACCRRAGVRPGAALRARRAVGRAARRARPRPAAACCRCAGVRGRARGDDDDEAAAPTVPDGPAGGEPGRAAPPCGAAWCSPTSCSTTCRCGCSSERRGRGGVSGGERCRARP